MKLLSFNELGQSPVSYAEFKSALARLDQPADEPAYKPATEFTAWVRGGCSLNAMHPRWSRVGCFGRMSHNQRIALQYWLRLAISNRG